MPLKKISGPIQSFDTFVGKVIDQVPSDEIKSKGTADESSVPENTHQSTLPHRVFHISVRNILDDKGLANALQVSWRYLYKEKGGTNAAAEIRIGTEEGKHHFNEISFGPWVEEMNQLLPKIIKLEELKDAPYELALLRMPTLRILVIWLMAEEREKDFFIPLSPSFHGLEPGKVYGTKSFLSISKKAAYNTLALSSDMDINDMRG